MDTRSEIFTEIGKINFRVTQVCPMGAMHSFCTVVKCLENTMLEPFSCSVIYLIMKFLLLWEEETLIFFDNLFCISLQLIKFIQVVLFGSSAFFRSPIIYRFIALQVFSAVSIFSKQGDVTTALIMPFTVMDYKRFWRNWYKQSYNSLCYFSLLI